MLPTLADLQVRPNDPNLAGCEASKSRFFGLFSSYYAVCNVNGPISVDLDADTEADALASFAKLDGRKAIDDACTDLEDALDIDGADMSEEDFASALGETGCAEQVRDLDQIVNAHAGTVAHLRDGWTLWRVWDAG